MAVNLSPVGGVAAQFFDNNGVILSGGKLYTYAAGTTTPQTTYTASNGAVAWTNPIVLNAAGRVPSGGEIWLTDGLQYKFVLKDSNDVTIATYDNITGINSNFVNYTNQQELQTATAGQTVFTLTTMTYQPGTNSLSVFVDGVNQYGPGALYAYTETDSTTVTFASGLHVGAEVKFTTSQINASSYGDASQIGFTGFKGQTGNVQDLADNDGSDWIGFEADGTGAVAISAQDKMRQIVSVKDFGAVGDGVADDTAAIQAAIDYAYAGGVGLAGAVYIPSGNYLCGQITTYPYTTIIGTGRHTSNLFCKPGTTGKWWSDRGNGAQKLMLSGVAFYGQNNLLLTHIAEFGDTGVQFGSEGILKDLWFRDSYSSYGLLCNANVGIFENITVQNCQYGAKILGNGNHITNLFAMQCDTIGADLSGSFARGVHAEATFSGGIPLKINGDTNVKDLTISTATGFTHQRLIQVDTTNYAAEWSVENVILLGSGYTVSSGIIQVGANYYGGTNPADFSGTSYMPSLTAYVGKFELAYQQLQAFNFRLFNDGGTIKHRIGSSGDSSLSTNLDNKINNASTTLTVTPTGANATTAFAAGAKISNPNTSVVILDTAAQLSTNAILTASISYNSSTTSLNVWPQTASDNVNGVTRTRLTMQFTNATTGANYDLTTLPSGAILEINVLAFLA